MKAEYVWAEYCEFDQTMIIWRKVDHKGGEFLSTGIEKIFSLILTQQNGLGIYNKTMWIKIGRFINILFKIHCM